MKKLVFSIATFALFLTKSFAQERFGLMLLPVSTTAESVSPMDVTLIQERVSKTLMDAGYFDLVERAALEEIEKEKKLQKTGAFIDSRTVDQGVTTGATYVLQCSVLGFELGNGTVKKSTENLDPKKDKALIAKIEKEAKANASKTDYRGRVDIQIKLIDIATSKILVNETVSAASNYHHELKRLVRAGKMKQVDANKKMLKADKNLPTNLNEVDAREFLLEDIEDAVVKITDQYFKPKYKIVDVNKKGEKIESLVINIGAKSKVEVGDQLTVYTVSTTTLDGKEVNRYKQICNLTIASVDDSNFSTCTTTEIKKLAAVDLQTVIIAKPSIKL